MKKWMITLVGLLLTLAVTTGVVFALTGDGSKTPEPEPSSDHPTATSIDDIDPNECNRIHNITACEGEPEPGFDVGEPYPLPDTRGPKGPTACEPDQSVAVTSDGQVSCLDLIPYGGDDLVSPASPPIVEPFQ